MLHILDNSLLNERTGIMHANTLYRQMMYMFENAPVFTNGLVLTQSPVNDGTVWLFLATPTQLEFYTEMPIIVSNIRGDSFNANIGLEFKQNGRYNIEIGYDRYEDVSENTIITLIQYYAEEQV